MRSQSQNIFTILIIFLCAFILRCFYFLFLKECYFFFDHPSTDVVYFQDWAREIASGNWLGNKTFYGLPLFAYFLAMLYRLTLYQIYIVPFILIALGAFSCVLTFLIAQKMFSNRTAWISTFLTITSFTLIHYDTITLPISLSIFFNLTILWLLINQTTIQKTSEWLLLGVIIGLGALVDGKLLIFAALFLVYEFLFKRSSIWLKQRLLIIVGIVLVIFSVGLRNKIVGGSWVWITAQSGLSFYVGNNETADGIYTNPSFIRPDHRGQDEDQIIIAEQISGKSLSDREVSQFWKNKGIGFIQKNPKKYLTLLQKKFTAFFQDNENAWDIDLLLQRNWKYLWDINPFWITCPLGILGILFSITRRKKEQIYPLLLITSQLIFTLIYFLTYRHRTVILPVLIIYEAFLLSWLLEQIQEKRWDYVFISLLLLILLFKVIPYKKEVSTQDWKLLHASKAAPIYALKGEGRTAELLYQVVLASDPKDDNTLYNLGSLYTSEKNFDQAIPIFKQILNKNPYQVDALYNLAYCYKETGHINESLNLFQEVLRLQPQTLDVKTQLFQIYLQQKNCNQARMYGQRITDSYPNYKTQIQKQLDQCLP
jgi:tetratricopeptide (TPR) repeat protein